ncbi:hypothetical protein D5085_06805 [Ectothiorhodospiraceae bacterium BW-2]|nr:hypothetical protein D5085_06805 [Ectothiorhodospiraceae bacterium BW-2]
MLTLLRWSLRLLLLLLLLASLLIAGLYWGLRSSLLEERLVPTLQPLIKEQSGIDLTVERLRLNLYGELELAGVRAIRQDHPQGEINFTLERLLLRYDLIQLLQQKRLFIETLQLTGLTLQGRLPLPTPAEIPEEEPPPSEPLSLAQLGVLLAEPPVDITLRELTLTPIDLDLVLFNPEQEMTIQGRLDATAAAEWVKGLFSGEMALSLTGIASPEAAFTLTQTGVSLQSHPHLATQLSWQLQQDQNAQWQLQLNPFTLTVGSGETALTQQLSERRVNLDFDNWQLTLALLLQSEPFSPQQPLTLSPQLQLTHRLQQLQLALESRDSLTLNATLSQQLSLQLDSQIKIALNEHGALQPQAPLPLQLQLQAEHQLTLDTLQLLQSDNHLKLTTALEHQLSSTISGDIADLHHPASASLGFGLEQQLTLPHIVLQAEENQLTLTAPKLDLTLSSRSTAATTATALWPDINAQLEGELTLEQLALHQAGQLHLTTEPALQLQLAASLPAAATFDHQQLQLQLSQQLTNRQLEFDYAAAPQPLQVSIAEQQWQLDATLTEDNATLTTTLQLQQLASPYTPDPIDITHTIALKSHPNRYFNQLNTHLQLNQNELLQLDLNLTDEPQTSRIEPQLTLQLPQSLANLLPQAEIIRTLGTTELQLAGIVQLHHRQPSLQQADFATLSEWPLESDIGFTLTQSAPPERQGLTLTHPLQGALIFARLEGRDNIDLRLSSAGVHHTPLRQPLPFSLQLSGDLDPELRLINSRGQFQLNQQPLLDYQLQLTNRPQLAIFTSSWQLHADPAWQRYLAELAPLQQLGGINLETQLSMVATHPADSVVALTPELDLSELAAELSFKGSLSQWQLTPKALVALPRPLQFEHNLSWSEQQATLKGRLTLGALTLPKQLILESLQLPLELTTNHGLTPTGATITLGLDGELIALYRPDQAPLDLTPLIAPLTLSLVAELDDSQQSATLDSLQLSLGNHWFTQRLEGSAKLDGSRAVVNGETSVRLRPELIKDPLTLSGNGSLSLPWQVTLADNQLSLEGTLHFNRLSLQSSALALENLNGAIAITEELRLSDDGGVQFGYLLNPDPFQRVDFERIEPYLDSGEAVQLDTLSLGELTLGPLQTTMTVEQNLLRLQQFNLKLLGGHVAGQLYLDAAPGSWSIGLLSRITQVDLRQLLKTGEREAAPISARTALEFNLAQRLLEGRVDISDITRTQLLQLLDVIDPNHEDSQIGQIRSALGLAHPQWVAIEMERGLLNLTVAISLLSKPLTVRGLPLSPIIQRFGGEALNQLDKLPLE